MRHRITEEEKVALKIAKLVNDLSLDVEQVGRIIGRVAPRVSVRRIKIVAESADYELNDKLEIIDKINVGDWE